LVPRTVAPDSWRTRSLLRIVGSAALLSFAVGCGDPQVRDDAIDPLAPGIPTYSSLYAELADHRATMRHGERAFFELAEQVPAFAGFYLNSRQEWVVNLTQPTQESAMKKAFETVLNRIADSRAPIVDVSRTIILRQVEFSFRELDLWRTIAEEEVLNLHGVVSVDMDEEHNTVTIGL